VEILLLSESIVVLMGLLAVAMATAGVARNLPIPFTVLLVGVGIGLGELSHQWPVLAPLQHFHLSPELVLFVFLPALIFESGYTLDARQLIKDIGPVLAMAVPALLLSTFLVGAGLIWILDMDPVLALLFGALISATDPVAVIALFKELGAPLRLTVLVEGESLFNDATAIVVFNILLGIAVAGSFGWSAAGYSVLEFLWVFLGGLLVGVIMGLVFSEWMHRLSRETSGILTVSLVMVYLSFILAEHFLHVSGVMAVVSCALVLGAYGITRIPHEADINMRETWDFIAFLCNALLFLLVGLSVQIGELLQHSGAILLTILLVLVARAASIYGLLPMTTRLLRLPQIGAGERLIIWWGGLKGGLAIAIVLSIPPDLPGRQFLLHLTLGVVLFTLLINASTIRPLIKYFGFDRLSGEEYAELADSLQRGQERAVNLLRRLLTTQLISRVDYHRVSTDIGQTLSTDPGQLDSTQRHSHLQTLALRVESEELGHLYAAGILPRYVLLDLKAELQAERENIRFGNQLIRTGAARRPLSKLEFRILSRLREQDWLAGWMVRYQMFRLEQSLQREVTRILMSEAAVAYLRKQAVDDVEMRDHLVAAYEDHIQYLKQRISSIHKEFPAFHASFSAQLAQRVSIAAARQQAIEDQQHGEISAKPYTSILSRLDQALNALPPTSYTPPALAPEKLIQLVPLFNGLSEEVIAALAEQAPAVAFLPNDVVIAEGDKGSALYIISQGCTKVSRIGAGGEELVLNELHEGDFFGEMALLGDQTRHASITAVTPTTLLRLTKKMVSDLSVQHPEVKQRLHEVEQQRNASSHQV